MCIHDEKIITNGDDKIFQKTAIAYIFSGFIYSGFIYNGFVSFTSMG